jgi:hypothetical protein
LHSVPDFDTHRLHSLLSSVGWRGGNRGLPGVCKWRETLPL